MRSTRWLALGLPLVAGLVAASDMRAAHDDAALDPITFHDNLSAAGRERGGVREVSFEIRRGLWRPNGDDRPGTPMLAFVEGGRALRLPGPMLRVMAGTALAITVKNGTDSTLVLRGLTSEPTDSLVLVPGASSTVRTVAELPGTRFYFAVVAGRTLRDRRTEDAHLAGAIVVDAPGARRRDDVLLITGSFHGRDSLGRLDNSREFFVVNGRPWPFTRRMEAKVGDSTHYRVMNATRDVHPMHLHGTFFRVESRGGAWRDTVLGPEQERMVATELLPPGATMSMSWMPDRPGAWLFHCHLTFHVVANPGFGVDSLTLDQREAVLTHGHTGDPAHHVEQGMGGLFMVVNVPAPLGWTLPRTPRKVITFDVPDDSVAGDDTPVFAPTVTDGANVARPTVRRGPGGMLLLHQGEPTTVRVVNRSRDATAIHWHGMELENLYDGVVGLGGVGNVRTPAVMSGDSFEARMTPPRAGTFMYHTHILEIRQQHGGLYGAMIVLPAGATWDAAHDHVFIAGPRKDASLVLNGAKVAPLLEIEAGATHRFRFINITTGSPGIRFVLARPDSTPVEWRRHAKDAVDLPESRRVVVPARQALSMGETFDALYDAAVPGDYRLEVRSGAGVLMAQQPVRVVARRP